MTSLRVPINLQFYTKSMCIPTTRIADELLLQQIKIILIMLHVSGSQPLQAATNENNIFEQGTPRHAFGNVEVEAYLVVFVP